MLLQELHRNCCDASVPDPHPFRIGQAPGTTSVHNWLVDGRSSARSGTTGPGRTQSSQGLRCTSSRTAVGTTVTTPLWSKLSWPDIDLFRRLRRFSRSPLIINPHTNHRETDELPRFSRSPLIFINKHTKIIARLTSCGDFLDRH